MVLPGNHKTLPTHRTPQAQPKFIRKRPRTRYQKLSVFCHKKIGREGLLLAVWVTFVNIVNCRQGSYRSWRRVGFKFVAWDYRPERFYTDLLARNLSDGTNARQKPLTPKMLMVVSIYLSFDVNHNRYPLLLPSPRGRGEQERCLNRALSHQLVSAIVALESRL